MRPNLREWLEHLRGLQDSDRARQYFDYWWGEVLPDFFDACRNSLREDSEVAREWLDWLRGDARALINPVVGGQAGWQYAWLETILETTLLLAKRGQWTSSETSDSLIADIPRPPCSSSPPFPSAFWRDLAASLSGIYSAYRSRGHVLFPLVLKGGPKPAVLARFRLELLPFGSGEVFLSPGQAPLRCLEEDFSLTFRQAALAARRLLPADSDPGDVRVSIEPFESTDEAYLWNRPLKGPSAGGALALGLWSLWQAVPLDTGLAVSFALSEQSSDPPDGACHPVGGDIEKAKGCLQRGLRTLLVAAGQREELDAWGSELGFSVVRAKTVKQAAEAASGIARQLKVYYEALISRLDGTPWRHEDGRTVTARDIATSPRVVERGRFTATRSEAGQDAERGEDWEPALFYAGWGRARYYEEPDLEGKQLLKWEEERGRAQRAVILGAPGGGKSFLTALTAISLAEQGLQNLQEGVPLEELPLPVHLDLTDMARTLESGSEEPEAALLRTVCDHSPRELEPSFWSWLGERAKTGQGWLILDALDQVPDQQRPLLHSWLKRSEGQRWLCRGILTCRTPNYDTSWLPWRQVKEYELAPFEPGDVRSFVDRWFQGNDEKASALKSALELHFPLAHACRSPLITSLVCLVHEDQPLPEETWRRDLYNQALRLLLKRGWQARGESWSETDLDERLWVLEKLAWELFPRQPEVNQFGHREVLQALQQALKVLGLSTAPDQLRNDLLKSGILVEAGLDRRGQASFSFLHRSFLEYLTGRALAGRVAEEGWAAIADLVDRKAWHPAWQEVIIFLAGELEDPTSLLELLADEEKDDFFRHRLALATDCVAGIDVSTLGPDALSVAESVVNTAFSFSWKNDWYAVFVLLPTTRPLCRFVRSNAHRANPSVIATLCGWLSDENDAVRSTTLFFLRETCGAARADSDVIPASVNCFESSRDSQVRSCAIEILRRMGEATSQYPQAMSMLVRILNGKDKALNDSAHFSAARALGAMGAPAAVDLVLRGGDEYLRRGAAWGLGDFIEAQQDPNAIRALARCLLQAKEQFICRRIADVFRRIAPKIARRRDVLVALSRSVVRWWWDSAEREALVSALRAIGRAASDDQWLVTMLTDRLEQDRRWRVRAGAAYALSGLQGKRGDYELILQLLLRRMAIDANPSVRACIAHALIGLDEEAALYSELIPGLILDQIEEDESIARIWYLHILKNAPKLPRSPEVGMRVLDRVLYGGDDERFPAAITLGAILASLRERAILQMLLDHADEEDPAIRASVAEALGAMGEAIGQDAEVVQVLVERLEDRDSDVRWCALSTLTMLSSLPYQLQNKLVSAVVERLMRDRAKDVRRTASEVLGRMGAEAVRHAKVVPALLDCLLNDKDEFCRAGAAQALEDIGESAAGEPNVVPALVQTIQGGETEAICAMRALGAMGEAVIRDQSAIPMLLALFNDPKPPDDPAFSLYLRTLETLGDLSAAGIRLFTNERSEFAIRTVSELA
jgi:HEAT repeat protein